MSEAMGGARGRTLSAHGRAPDRWLGLAPQAMRDTLLVALSLTSGYVDAVSYLGLGAVFTSNMTGNTVLLGLALAQSRGVATLRSAVALAGFVGGVAIGAPLARRAGKDIWPRAVTLAFVVEFVVLLALAIWGIALAHNPVARTVYPLIALSAIAMGLQSVAVRALGVPGVVTTYITGTWVSLIAEVIDALIAPVHRAPGRSHPMRRNAPGITTTPSAASVVLQASVVGVYVVAAFLGGAAELRWRSAAFIVPALVVALVAGAALLRWRRQPKA